MGGESTCDVHPLLLTAGKRRRREIEMAARDIETRQKALGACSRSVRIDTTGQKRFGDERTRRDARNDPQELADIADGLAPQGQHLAR